MQSRSILQKTKRVLKLVKRERITRDRIRLSLILNDDGEAETFEGLLNLSGLGLPQDAYVVIEAMHGGDVGRFEIGEVGGGLIKIPQKGLEGLKSYGARIQFRVLVVDPHTRRILASAERLRPFPLKEEPLLPYVKKDIGRLAWEIEFSDEGPTLVINKNLPEGAFKSNEFVCYALPAVLREILSHAVLERAREGEEEDLEEPEDWKSQWLRFARELTGSSFRFLNPETAGFQEEFESWIRDAVQTFCDKRAMREWTNLLRGYQE